MGGFLGQLKHVRSQIDTRLIIGICFCTNIGSTKFGRIYQLNAKHIIGHSLNILQQLQERRKMSAGEDHDLRVWHIQTEPPPPPPPPTLLWNDKRELQRTTNIHYMYSTIIIVSWTMT